MSINPKRTLRLAGTRGLASDVSPYSLAPEFWSQVVNCNHYNGAMRTARPLGAAYGTLSDTPPLHLQNALLPDGNFWLYYTNDAVYAAEGANAHVDISPTVSFSSATAEEMTSTILNGLPIFNNANDAPHWWSGSTSDEMDELPDWPAGSSCGAIAAFQYHLFALDISETGGDFPDKVMWSDAAPPGAVPGSWTPSPSNEAGDTQLSATPGRVMCAVPLRGSLLIYKTSSVYVVDYIGGNEKFSFRPALSSVGAISRKAVCDIGGRHVVVTDGDIMVTDGVTAESIATGRVRDYLFQQLNVDKALLIWCAHHAALGQVWIGFPTTGSDYPDQALVWDYKADVWGTQSLPQVPHAITGVVSDTAGALVWDSVTSAWNVNNYTWRAPAGASGQSMVLAGPANLLLSGRPGTPYTGYLERIGLSMRDETRFKFCKRVHVRTGGVAPVDVRIGAEAAARAGVAWQLPQTLNPGEQFVNASVMGRQIAVAVTLPSDESIEAMQIEYEDRGYL